MSDDAMVRIARELADALRRYARERRTEDQQQVRQLQTELCAIRRQELEAQESAVKEESDEHSDCREFTTPGPQA
jgi:hypothetical protein